MIKRLLSIFLILTLTSLFLCVPASASIVDGIENIPGDGQYMADAYIENYEFDCEELGALDGVEAIGLVIGNMLFSLCRIGTTLFLYIFRLALQLNIAEFMGGKLDEVQTVLSDSIFEPLFIVGFMGIAFALLKKLALRNVTGIMADFGKVMLILIFVALLARNTSEVLTGTTTIARDLGLSVVMEMNGRSAEDSTASFVDETVGVLWGDLIHRPWIEMEFDGAQTDSDVQAILSKSPGSEDRQNVVNDYIAAHPGAFSKGAAWARIAPLLLFALASLIKIIVYGACAILVLAFQLLAIFYSLLGVIILLLAMFDALGGLHLISDWLKRMLETQLMTLVTTMLLGFIVWFGGILDALGGTLGWLGGLLFQAVVIVVLFAFREKVFRGLVNISKNPAAAAHHLAAPSTAAFIGGFRQLNQPLDGGFLQTRLDRKEQLSRIRLNESRIGCYGEELALATERIALTHERSALTQTQQQKEELLLEHEEAKKEKRLERDAAKAQRQANRPTQDGVERPQTTPSPHEELRREAEPEEPAVARPMTQESSEVQNAQEQKRDTVRPVTQRSADASPAHIPAPNLQNTTQGVSAADTPKAERPFTQPPNIDNRNNSEEAGGNAAMTEEKPQSARPHTQGFVPTEENMRAETQHEIHPAIERPVTQMNAAPYDMPKTVSGSDREHSDADEVSVRPSIPQASHVSIQSASAQAPVPQPTGEVRAKDAMQQPTANRAQQGAVQVKQTSSPVRDTGAAAKEAAAAARVERKHREAGRTVTSGNIAYSAPMPEKQSDSERPQLREALNTEKKEEGEVSNNENHD